MKWWIYFVRQFSFLITSSAPPLPATGPAPPRVTPGDLSGHSLRKWRYLFPEDKAGQAVLAVTWPPHSHCGLNCSWAGIENNHPLCAISALPRKLSTSYQFPPCQAPENKPTMEPRSALVQSAGSLDVASLSPPPCRIFSCQAAQGCRVRCLRVCALSGFCFSSCWHA